MFDLLVILLGIILLAIIRVPIRKSDFDEPPKTRRRNKRRVSRRPGGLPWYGQPTRARYDEYERQEKRESRGKIKYYWSDYD